MNNVSLTGRLTADVELKATPSGLSVCTFTIAVKRPHTKDTTDFINCVAWRNTAEFISAYFKKGNMIALCGALTQRNYEDKNGNKRTAYEVLIDNAEFCGEKAKSEQNVPNTQEKEQEPHFEELKPDDDLPF